MTTLKALLLLTTATFWIVMILASSSADAKTTRVMNASALKQHKQQTNNANHRNLDVRLYSFEYPFIIFCAFWLRGQRHYPGF
jgi:hypothetical protein